MLFFSVSCQSGLSKDKGGNIDLHGNLGSVTVEQPENAKEPAKGKYNENSVVIPMNEGDELEIHTVTEPNGKTDREVIFKPKNETEVQISVIEASGETGASYKDMVGELNVFLQNSKIIMWVGVGFLVAGGLFGGLLRDVRTGLVLGGIGVLMLGAYALLPTLYSNGALIIGGLVIVIPVLWWLDSKKHSRIAKASQKTHNKLKVTNPELAKKNADEFKKHLAPSDIDYLKKLDNQ